MASHWRLFRIPVGNNFEVARGNGLRFGSLVNRKPPGRFTPTAVPTKGSLLLGPYLCPAAPATRRGFFWHRPLGHGERYLIRVGQNIHDPMRPGSMASDGANLDFKPRRGKARLRAGVPAVLVSMTGRQVVSLIDLSESGAGLVVKDGWRLNGGVLKWMDYEVYGKVVRRSGDSIGLLFDEPIDTAWVLETRTWLPQLRRNRDPFRRSAAEKMDDGAPSPQVPQVPGMVASKYGTSGLQQSAVSMRAAAPLLFGALMFGAAVGYGSSLF